MSSAASSKKADERNEKYAVIRIRGLVGPRHDIRKTMQILKLYRKNYCAIVPKNKATSGMMNKIKDYCTYGEIDDETFKLLIEKKGEEYKGPITDKKGKINYNSRYIVVGDKKIKSFFRLSPPKGGFERKGIKVSYSKGGALGYRGKDINALIKRMI